MRLCSGEQHGLLAHPDLSSEGQLQRSLTVGLQERSFNTHGVFVCSPEKGTG